MLVLKKVIWFGFISLLLVKICVAWNIGSKGRVVGPTIHTTYFLTTNNALFPVRAVAYVGNINNGSCTLNYNLGYPLGTEHLRSGDFVDIDGLQLLSLIGSGYTCMAIFYTQKQLTMETFQLYFDGIHYIGSNPITAEVTIL